MDEHDKKSASKQPAKKSKLEEQANGNVAEKHAESSKDDVSRGNPVMDGIVPLVPKLLSGIVFNASAFQE